MPANSPDLIPIEFLENLKVSIQYMKKKKSSHLVIRFVGIFEALDVVEELLKVGRQVFQQQSVVIFLFHQSHLFFVLHLPPGQLPIDELHQHVEQAPEIIVSTHFCKVTLTITLSNYYLKLLQKYLVVKKMVITDLYFYVH